MFSSETAKSLYHSQLCVADLRLRTPHPTKVSTPVPMFFPRLGNSAYLHSGEYHCSPTTRENFPGGNVCSAHTRNTPFSRHRTLQLRRCENTRDVCDVRLDAQRACTTRLPKPYELFCRPMLQALTFWCATRCCCEFYPTIQWNDSTRMKDWP